MAQSFDHPSSKSHSYSAFKSTQASFNPHHSSLLSSWPFYKTRQPHTDAPCTNAGSWNAAWWMASCCQFWRNCCSWWNLYSFFGGFLLPCCTLLVFEGNLSGIWFGRSVLESLIWPPGTFLWVLHSLNFWFCTFVLEVVGVGCDYEAHEVIVLLAAWAQRSLMTLFLCLLRSVGGGVMVGLGGFAGLGSEVFLVHWKKIIF